MAPKKGILKRSQPASERRAPPALPREAGPGAAPADAAPEDDQYDGDLLQEILDAFSNYGTDHRGLLKKEELDAPLSDECELLCTCSRRQMKVLFLCSANKIGIHNSFIVSSMNPM